MHRKKTYLFPTILVIFWKKKSLNNPKSQCITNCNLPNHFLQNQNIDPNLAKLHSQNNFFLRITKNTHAPGNAYNPDKMYYNGSITHALTYTHAYFVLLQYNNALCVAPRTSINNLSLDEYDLSLDECKYLAIVKCDLKTADFLKFSKNLEIIK